VLKRFDAVADTTERIMAGDLSGRLPVTGIGDELDRLAVNLNVMLERIEALMRGLKEVSDNIAHDLKTPLTRLRNRCEAALRTARTENDYRGALEGMIEESDGLIRTFDALLMIARAESGQARDNMVDFDAAEIVRGVCELYEPVADDKGLRMRTEAPEPAPIKGNRELLSQALANLIDNAIKYARPSVQVSGGDGTSFPEIAIGARRAGDRVLLTVADHGPGIPAADRSRVLERFVRLTQDPGEPGSGLGLSLAAAVARLHGGELTLEDSAPGLRVVMSLPAR
jgi:signal transduction histidine kinase